ncbi:MAG TPA: HigA family addiction module antitoxin [Trueperaceae bacterium]|nr:HigA family addiction module antitoxin [Trueperaceae bacterium]
MFDHPHPGEILKEDVLEPLGLSVTEAAERLGITRPNLSRVLNGKAGISPELALRLELAGASTARFWMNLQTNYELTEAAKRPRPRTKPLTNSLVAH